MNASDSRRLPAPTARWALCLDVDGTLLELARHAAFESARPGGLTRALLFVMASRLLRAAFFALGRILRATGLAALGARSLPKIPAMRSARFGLAMLAATDPSLSAKTNASKPRSEPVAFGARGSVALLEGCVQKGLYERVNDATGHSEGLRALGRGIFSAEAGGHGAEAVVKPVVNSLTWWQNGSVEFTVGTRMDGLVVMMLFVVTLISLLVHVYSLAYLRGDVRFTHYYAFLSLFTASMLMFVLTENTLQLIVGWELVGLCSFALIGHWWEEKPNSDAALKAFLTNRVGDVGLLVGMITLYFGAGGTFDITTINTMANSGQIDHLVLLVSSLCLITAVMSKSGQFILHTWLPDAMAGPTPVSALIHAATMVVAGIYMVGRLYAVFFEGLSIGVGTAIEPGLGSR